MSELLPDSMKKIEVGSGIRLVQIPERAVRFAYICRDDVAQIAFYDQYGK